MKKFVLILLLSLAVLSCLAVADRLPPQKPENQLISELEHINVIGPVIKNINLVSEQSSAYLHDGILLGSFDTNGAAVPTDTAGTLQNLGEVVSQTTYHIEELTNGGFLEQMYSLDYNTRNTFGENWNLETYWIMTYETADGSTLASTERVTLDIAANYETSEGNRRCIFALSGERVMPAFCNLVTAESTLASVTSMTVQTPLKLRDTAQTADVPEMIIYEIAVDPNTATNNHYADGQVGVTFTASVREANRYFAGRYYQPNPDWNNNYWDDEARITNYVETITATGGITKLSKSFAYASVMGL